MGFEKDGKGLYACAIERLDARGQPVEGKMFHIHAESAAQAKMHFQVTFPDRRKFRIVDAALCIGFYVENKQGTIVSAT